MCVGVPRRRKRAQAVRAFTETAFTTRMDERRAIRRPNYPTVLPSFYNLYIMHLQFIYRIYFKNFRSFLRLCSQWPPGGALHRRAPVRGPRQGHATSTRDDDVDTSFHFTLYTQRCTRLKSNVFAKIVSLLASRLGPRVPEHDDLASIVARDEDLIAVHTD